MFGPSFCFVYVPKLFNTINLVERLKDCELNWTLSTKTYLAVSDYIRPLCLPPPEFQTNDFVNKLAIVTGWGITSFDENGDYNNYSIYY